MIPLLADDTQWSVESGRLKVWWHGVLIIDMALEYVVYSIMQRIVGG